MEIQINQGRMEEAVAENDGDWMKEDADEGQRTMRGRRLI
jgi:hypothetical protein